MHSTPAANACKVLDAGNVPYVFSRERIQHLYFQTWDRCKSKFRMQRPEIILNIREFIELQTKTLDQQCKLNDCKIREDKKEPAILRMEV